MSRPKSGRIVRSGLRNAGITIVVALHAAAVAAAASADNADPLFEAGRVAFQAGDYEIALRHYEAAARAGMRGAVIEFNIGVAAYRASQLDRAAQAFEQAARSPSMFAIANYNLGLVARAKGDQITARKYFDRVAKQTDDERLRSLALRQLGPTRPSPLQRWEGYASAALGYDDNVALAPGSDVLEVSGQEDAFVEAQAAVSSTLDEHWRVDAGLDRIDYLDLDDFDLLSTHAAARYRFEKSEWRHDARFQLTYSRIGSDSFETRQAISLQSSRALNSEWLFRARYRFTHLDGLGAYEGLGGTRHELQTRVSYGAAPVRLSLSYEYELNDQRSASLATHRQQIQVLAERELDRDWIIEADTTVQQSHYEASSNDTMTELGLSISKALTVRWRAMARVAHLRNESRDSALDYDVNQISLGTQIEF